MSRIFVVYLNTIRIDLHIAIAELVKETKALYILKPVKELSFSSPLRQPILSRHSLRKEEAMYIGALTKEVAEKLEKWQDRAEKRRVQIRKIEEEARTAFEVLKEDLGKLSERHNDNG